MDWQLIIVIAAILGALFFLGRRTLGWLRGSSKGCRSCHGCSTTSLVSLDASRPKQ